MSKLTARLGYGFGAAFAAVIAAALVVPELIDWSRYRDDVARALSQATGRDIAIHGDVKLTILPVPTLRARDVRLANVPGGTAADFAQIGAFEIRLAVLPLVGGRIEAQSVSLVAPVIELEILADGRPNWRLERMEPNAAGGDSRSDNGIAMRFETVTIEGGTIAYRSAKAGHQLTLQKVDATVTAGEDTARYRARGKAQIGTLPLNFDAAVEAERGNGLVPLRIGLRHARSGARGQFDGYLESPPEALRLAGSFRATGEKFGELIAEADSSQAPLPPWLAGKFTVDSALTMAGAELAFNDVTLQLEDLQGKGSVAVTLGTASRVEATLGLNRLDLDRLIQATSRPAPEPTTPSGGGSGTAAGGSAPPPPVFPEVVAMPTFELPRGPRLALNLTIDALVYRRDIIRNLRLNATLLDGKVNLLGLAAQLPGAADLALSGTLATVERRPKFEGAVTLNAGSLRGVLDWLGVDASRVPAGRLRSLALTGTIDADAEAVRLNKAQMELDLSRASGSVGMRLGAQPTALVDLTVDRLDLESYWPRERPAARSETKAKAEEETAEKPERAEEEKAASERAAKESTGSDKAPPPLPTWRGPENAEIQLAVGTLVVEGRALNEARFRGTITKDTLVIERASFQDHGGLRGGVTGTVRGLKDEPTLNLNIDAQATELIDLLRLAGLQAPATMAHAGPALIRGSVKGAPSNLSISLRADGAGANLTLDGIVSPPLVNPRFDVALAIKHPDAGDLAPLFPGMVPPGIELEGPASLSTHLRGDYARFDFTDLRLVLNRTEVTGSGALELARLRPRLTGRFATGPLTLDQLFVLPAVLVADLSPDGRTVVKGRRPEVPLDLTGLSRLDATLEIRPKSLALGTYRLDEPEIQMALTDGTLDLSRIAGRLFGGDLVGKVRAGGGTSPQVRAAFAISKANLGQLLSSGLDEPEAEGALDLEVEIQGEGRSVDALIGGLKGSARIAARNGVLRGFDLGRINAKIENRSESVGLINLLQEGMSHGETAFSALEGNFAIEGGVARTEDLKLTANGGTGKASGSIDLNSRVIDGTAEFHLAATPDAPPFRVRLSGPPGALRAVFRFNELQQFLLKNRPG